MATQIRSKKSVAKFAGKSARKSAGKSTGKSTPAGHSQASTAERIHTTASYRTPSHDELLTEVRQALATGLDETVAWYRAQMPAHYFQVTPPSEQTFHVQLLHSLRTAQDPRLTVIDDPRHGKLLVLGSPERHSLAEVIPVVAGHQAATNHDISRIELHTAGDRSVFLYAFGYGPVSVPGDFDLGAHRAAILREACGRETSCSLAAKRYLDVVDQGYLARSRVDRVVRHVLAWARLERPEDLHVQSDQPADGTATRILLAAGGVTMWPLLKHIAQVLTRYRLAFERGYLDWVPAVTPVVTSDPTSKALIATIYVHDAAGKNLSAKVVAAIESDLLAVRDQYSDALSVTYTTGEYGLTELATLRAVACAASYLIGPDHPYLDVNDIAVEALLRNPALGHGLAELLATRFCPGHTRKEPSWQRAHAELLAQAHAVAIPAQALVLEAMIKVIAGVQATNAWRPGRLGLAFKLAPELLPAGRFPQQPFGVFFFFGPHARGFHVRFRASARGGLRLLIPKNPTHYAMAREGVLKEVYDLAWAQQLKNKDIPEGGSKCIALVELGADPDAAVKQVVDAFLDLLVPASRAPEVIGPFGTSRVPDLIFLGPDENMTPARIVWVTNRAHERGLPHHATLMSSKPGAGINHKEFGVTSEGIFSWLRVVLPLIGIGDKQPYSLKITGGPDGDLGGNLLRILHREHGARVRVVAIGDGTGAAFDPHGLDWRELLRLVREGKGIAAFDAAKLTPAARKAGAKVVPATDREGEQFRNQLHNTVPADVFIPCGGRPNSIHEGNWREFLSNGRPTAKAMIEGANIFITSHARHELEDAGLLVIKDSSANKGGVICSSYEVLAGLVLEDAEFLSIKPAFVKEVVGIIRARAESEAKALISAWKRRAGHVRLSDLSQQISAEINRVNSLIEGFITEHLADQDLQGTWTSHLEGHCPPALLQWRERLLTRIPREHRVAILSKRLASRMVYQEGLTWCATYLADGERLWETLRTYLEAEKEVAEVCQRLAALDLPDGETMIRVVRTGAQRELVRRRLGNEF
jgi:glutamate dehydrogenase